MHIYEENAPFRCFSLVFSLGAEEVAKNSKRKRASQIPCNKYTVYVMLFSLKGLQRRSFSRIATSQNHALYGRIIIEENKSLCEKLHHQMCIHLAWLLAWVFELRLNVVCYVCY